MSQKDKTCTISGLRPHKLPIGTDMRIFMCALEREIRKSISEGYNTFLSGLAMGADIWAAQIIIRLKKEYDDLYLICFQPCETQADNWSAEWRRHYFKVLELSDYVLCLQENYSANCMHLRNIRMIDSSFRLIAVHDGISKGGTAHTINYAKNQGLEVIKINPLEL